MPIAAAEAPSTIDPPFLAPIECVVDLPFAPSANRLWRADAKVKVNGQIVRRAGVRRSDEYKKWMREADMACVVNGTWRKRQQMPGLFAAEILLDRGCKRGRCDVDNRIKAVLDWAQRVSLIKNDELCEDVRARWVTTAEAPAGCRLILRSVA